MVPSCCRQRRYVGTISISGETLSAIAKAGYTSLCLVATVGARTLHRHERPKRPQRPWIAPESKTASPVDRRLVLGFVRGGVLGVDVRVGRVDLFEARFLDASVLDLLDGDLDAVVGDLLARLD